MLMGQQRQDASKRVAQHILAREIVELAHGAEEAKEAETAHKEAFSHGTTTFSLSAIRNTLSKAKLAKVARQSLIPTKKEKKKKAMDDYKKAYIATATAQNPPGTVHEQSKDQSDAFVTLPLSMLQPGSFSRILHAAGLATSKSDAHRLIANKGAYVVVPNSGSEWAPTALQWVHIEVGAVVDPNHFLVDFEALVLRSGKSKIQICRIVSDEQFEVEGLTCIGWDDVKAKQTRKNTEDAPTVPQTHPEPM